MTTTSATQSTQVTCTKLRDGSWGLRGANLTPGATVTVAKKSGETKTETVGRVLWTGNGVSLATIAGSMGERDAMGRTSTGRKCIACGHVEQRNSRGYVDGDRILRSGECQSCYEERKMGY